MINPSSPTRVAAAAACLLASAALAEEALTLDASAARLDLAAQGEATGEEVPPPNESIFTADGWKGNVNLGLNGSTGNNENFNVRAAVSANKETLRNEALFDLTYTYGSSDGDTDQNELDANARYDWLLRDSPWRVFIIGSYEYDEFQDWDHRVTIGPGVGYQAIKTERTDLLLRGAVLAVREFGGSDDDWRAELNPGLDFAHQITERQSFVSTLDFYSDVSELGDYRFIGSAAWRIEVDPENNLFLEIGVEDEYDSDPGPDTKKNDFSYYASLGWSF